jgi:hypothetical protein
VVVGNHESVALGHGFLPQGIDLAHDLIGEPLTLRRIMRARDQQKSARALIIGVIIRLPLRQRKAAV